MEQHVPRELPPPQLGEEARGPLAARPPLAHRVPHLEGAQLAPAQVRRQARGHLLRRFVASLRVRGQVVVEEVPQALVRGIRPGRPRLAQAVRPVGVGGQQLPGVEVVARGIRRVDRVGRGQRMPRLGRRAARPPERGEHRERRALARADRPGLEQQVGREAAHDEPVVVQRLLQSGVELALGAAVAAVPEHRAGAGLVDERADDPVGRSATQHEPSADRLERIAERREGAVQPPARGAAERRMPGVSSSSTKTHTIGAPRSTAACSAGWSATRRSSRNQTIDGVSRSRLMRRP